VGASTAHLAHHDDAFPGGVTAQTHTALDANCQPDFPPPPTPPSCLDCLEVVPNGLLLPGVGAQRQLRAFLVDASGVRTPVSPTWTSSNPEHVIVTGGGLAEAVSAVGSSQIMAESGGQTSAPVLALVAQPVAGVLLIDDSDVEGTITPVDPAAPYRPGWQYRVTLRNLTPAVGQIVIGTGQIPIAGRTVSVTPAATLGLVDVVLESVAAAQAFTAFSIKQTFPLTQWLPAPEAPLGASATGGTAGFADSLGGKPTAMTWQSPAGGAQPVAASSLGELEFDLGPFKCEASVGATLGADSLILGATSFDITPDLEIEVDVDLTGVHKALMTGSIAPQLMVNPVTQVAVSGQLECKKLLKIIPLPVTGAASIFFGARVALGVGFGLEAELPVGGFGVDLFVNGTASVNAGVECAEECDVLGDVDGSAGGFLKPVLPSAQDGWGQVEVAFSGFGWAEFRIGGPIEATQATLLEAAVGLKQKAELASEKNQALDTGFAASFGLDFFADAKTGKSLELVGAFLGTDLLEFTSEYELPLAQSPAGTFTITPASVRAGSATELGELATFTVDLDLTRITYLGIDSVESVEIRWLKDDGSGNMVLANGRPGCTSLASSPGQTHFTCQTDFLAEHAGTQTFFAFVKAKLFGVTVPILLETADDAKATVTVTNPSGELQGTLTFSQVPSGGFVGLHPKASVTVSVTARQDSSWPLVTSATGTGSVLMEVPGECNPVYSMANGTVTGGVLYPHDIDYPGDAVLEVVLAGSVTYAYYDSATRLCVGGTPFPDAQTVGYPLFYGTFVYDDDEALVAIDFNHTFTLTQEDDSVVYTSTGRLERAP
jgi:hypothetical protein